MNKETIKKALLEAGRLVVLAIPGILIQVVSNDPALAASYGGIILLILKSLDRGVHESKTTDATGVLPF